MQQIRTDHLQESLISTLSDLSDKGKARLRESWAYTFRHEFLIRLDESLFAVLYSEKPSRPNIPVNVLVGLEALKATLGWSDRQMHDNFLFDTQVRYALGYENLGEGDFDLRTVYNFRKRVCDHLDKTGENLIARAFEQVTDAQVDAFEIETGHLRMDTTQIATNVCRMGRLQLLVTILQRTHRMLSTDDQARYAEAFAPYLKGSAEQYVYHIKGQNTKPHMQRIGALMQQLVSELASTYESHEAYQNMARVFCEQFRLKKTKSSSESDDGDQPPTSGTSSESDEQPMTLTSDSDTSSSVPGDDQDIGAHTLSSAENEKPLPTGDLDVSAPAASDDKAGSSGTPLPAGEEEPLTRASDLSRSSSVPSNDQDRAASTPSSAGNDELCPTSDLDAPASPSDDTGTGSSTPSPTGDEEPSTAISDLTAMTMQTDLEPGLMPEIEVRPGQEISPARLRSPDDTEATYRRKAGKAFEGHVANVIETCDLANAFQLILMVQNAPNITEDTTLLLEALCNLVDRTNVHTIINDAGFCSAEVDQALREHGLTQIPTNLAGRTPDPQYTNLADCSIHFDDNNQPIKLTCPHGHTAKVEAGRKPGRFIARWLQEPCGECHFAPHYTGYRPSPKTCLRFSQTDLDRALRRQRMRAHRSGPNDLRAAVEATVGAIKRPFGNDKVPVRGSKRLNQMLIGSAIMVNIRRIHRHMVGLRKEAQGANKEQAPGSGDEGSLFFFLTKWLWPTLNTHFAPAGAF